MKSKLKGLVLAAGLVGGAAHGATPHAPVRHHHKVATLKKAVPAHTFTKTSKIPGGTKTVSQYTTTGDSQPSLADIRLDRMKKANPEEWAKIKARAEALPNQGEALSMGEGFRAEKLPKGRGSRNAPKVTKFIKRGTSKLMRRITKQDPENAPTKRPTRGYAD